MTLSILIPTTPARRPALTRLLDCLTPQLAGDIKITALETPHRDSGGPTIGEKRQTLLAGADTPYVCFVDTDDMVSADYCPLILDALGHAPDVVGFRMRHYADGELVGLFALTNTVLPWGQGPHAGIMRYQRIPMHLNPVRRALALEIGFKALQCREDVDYAERLNARFALREVFIDAFLYEYRFATNKSLPLHS